MTYLQDRRGQISAGIKDHLLRFSLGITGDRKEVSPYWTFSTIDCLFASLLPFTPNTVTLALPNVYSAPTDGMVIPPRRFYWHTWQIIEASLVIARHRASVKSAVA
jgi:hypothetical protein